MVLFNDLDTIVLVVSILVEGVVFTWVLDEPVLVYGSFFDVRIVFVSIRSIATIIRVVNVDVGVRNVDVLSFVAGNVSEKRIDFYDICLLFVFIVM